MNKGSTLLFLGDVIPYKPRKFKNSYKTVINLECPITIKGNPALGKINLSVKENYLKNIFDNNLFCICLGNNHIFDYGKVGIDSTLDSLDKMGLPYFGINNVSEYAYPQKIIELNKNIRIAFFAVVCPSTSPIWSVENKLFLSMFKINELIENIKKIRASVQKVVIYIHWGTEESSYPSNKEVLDARNLIDGGADLVIGSHAHAPQPIEKYKNGIIAYNLGNFIMPAMKKIPSYYNESQVPVSSYTKYLMLWNRISWGLIVDMESMEYKIKMYLSILNRNIELPFASLYKYVKLPKNILNTGYELRIKKHLRKRAIYRKLTSFIIEPHIPQKLKRIL